MEWLEQSDLFKCLVSTFGDTIVMSNVFCPYLQRPSQTTSNVRVKTKMFALPLCGPSWKPADS